MYSIDVFKKFWMSDSVDPTALDLGPLFIQVCLFEA